MKFVGWLFGALVATILTLFAVSNRMPVELRFEPLPYLIELPLFVIAFATLVAGFVVGGIAAWLGGGKWRRRARKAEAESVRLRRELGDAQKPREIAPPENRSLPPAAPL